MSSPSHDADPFPGRGSVARTPFRATDSPWFWGMMFSGMALVGLGLVMFGAEGSRTNPFSEARFDVGSLSEDVAKKISYFENKKIVGTEESVEQLKDSFDMSFKKYKARSSFKLIGTSRVNDWKLEDDNGVSHFGVVMIWSYNELKNQQNILNNRNKADPTTDNRLVIPESRSSKPVNRAADF